MTVILAGVFFFPKTAGAGRVAAGWAPLFFFHPTGTALFKRKIEQERPPPVVVAPFPSRV